MHCYDKGLKSLRKQCFKNVFKVMGEYIYLIPNIPEINLKIPRETVKSKSRHWGLILYT